MPGDTKPAGGGGKRRRRRLAGGRGDILLNSLEQEMLQWALHGFQPAGPDGLKPTPGIHVILTVPAVDVMHGEMHPKGL